MKDMVLLVIISHIYIGAQGKCAVIGRDDLVQDLKQGRLAGAVITDGGIAPRLISKLIQGNKAGRKGLA